MTNHNPDDNWLLQGTSLDSQSPQPNHTDTLLNESIKLDTMQDAYHLTPVLPPDHSQTHLPPTWAHPTVSYHSAPSSFSSSTANDSNELSPSPHHHFDASQPQGIVIGNPSTDSQFWQQQITPTTCGIANEQAAIAHLTGHNYTQEQLANYEQAQGWYDSHTGTTGGNFGKAIENIAHIPIDRHFGGTVNEIAQKLNHHEDVFVGVNAQALNLPDSHSLLGHAASNLFDPHHYVTQPANHIVQVTGIEYDPHTLQPNYVVVNDPGTPDGRAMEVPVEQFKVAMDASQGYIASTVTHPENHLSGHQHDPALDSVSFRCEVSTYYNSDSVWIDADRVGTYNGHTFYWNSGKTAGTWDCAHYRAVSANGKDLGYAKTWKDAALLIYKQN